MHWRFGEMAQCFWQCLMHDPEHHSYSSIHVTVWGLSHPRHHHLLQWREDSPSGGRDRTITLFDGCHSAKQKMPNIQKKVLSQRKKTESDISSILNDASCPSSFPFFHLCSHLNFWSSLWSCSPSYHLFSFISAFLRPFFTHHTNGASLVSWILLIL